MKKGEQPLVTQVIEEEESSLEMGVQAIADNNIKGQRIFQVSSNVKFEPPKKEASSELDIKFEKDMTLNVK